MSVTVQSRTEYGPDRSVFTDGDGDRLTATYDFPDDDMLRVGGSAAVLLNRPQQLALVRMIMDRLNGPSMFTRRSYDGAGS